MTTPRWNRPAREPKPQKGAAPSDYAGFAFCTVVVIWMLAAWAGWFTMRPPWSVLLITLMIGLGVGARSRPMPDDRWHVDHARLAPFIWAGRGVAVLVLGAASVLTYLSLTNGQFFGTEHVILWAAVIGYAVLAVSFAPVAADPRWKPLL